MNLKRNYKKSLSEESKRDQNTKNADLLSALNAPTSIVEINEQPIAKK